jgi:signal transduction histidine kinase
MVATLESRLKYVEEFSRGISHELKTPITAIKGSVEILRDNWSSMTTEERERFMGIIQSDIDRTERLVRRILELAKLESSHPPEGTCDLVDVLRPMIKRAGASDRVVSLITGTDRTAARIPHEMAELLLGSLLENAFVHGALPFEIEITEGPAVAIRDHGNGIPTEHMSRIFDKFFTTARSRGGTGLGLSIAKAVAGMYGVSIRADSMPGLTEFRVGFAGSGPESAKTRSKPGQEPDSRK